MAEALYQYHPTALQALESNAATFEVLDVGTVHLLVAAFDTATDEYLNGVLRVTPDLDTSGTVTFQAAVTAETAAASKNIAMTFGHRAINDSEALDGSYTDVDSGDKAIDATQDDLTLIDWTATVATLGWSANDLVVFRISRDTTATNDLDSDMFLIEFSIRVPIT